MESDEPSVVLEEPLINGIQDAVSTEIISSATSGRNANDNDDVARHPLSTPSANNSTEPANGISPVQPLLHSIAPFNPSSRQAQDKALSLFSLTHDDVLFDLGCGDGRFLITAAQQVEGLRCVGIELNPLFVQRGRAAIAKLPLDIQNRVQIRQGNLLFYNDENREPLCEKDEVDDDSSHQCLNLTIREDATAMYLYLLPKGLARFKSDFLDSLVDERMELGKRIRIVSFTFRVHGWDPVAIDDGMKGGVRQYLYEFGSDSPENTTTPTRDIES